MDAKSSQSQGGFALIEALVAITVFSFALIGMIAMQSAALTASTESKWRSDAAYLATQIIGLVWSDRGNIANYNHLNTGAPCTPGGAASDEPAVLAWLAEVSAALPGAISDVQSLAIGADNTLTVTICWKRAEDATYHQHVTVTQIN